MANEELMPEAVKLLVKADWMFKQAEHASSKYEQARVARQAKKLLREAARLQRKQRKRLSNGN